MEQSYLAMLLALRDRRQTILTADPGTATVVAEHRLRYRSHFYNVTWVIQVDATGQPVVTTQRDRHHNKQYKHIRRWWENLRRSYLAHRCSPIDQLRMEVGAMGVLPAR